jgi:exosome complex component RRP4
MKKFIFPGDLIEKGKLRAEGVYYSEGSTYSSVTGMYDDESKRIIIFNGPYIPKTGDVVIGVIEDIRGTGYSINFGLPLNSYISSRDIRETLNYGDIVVAKISNYDESDGSVELTEHSRLRGGIIIHISPFKIPRVIGKKGSMLEQIKNKTNSKIIVGKNGWVWIKDGNVNLTKHSILKIEKEAHVSGLTDKIAKFLEDNEESLEIIEEMI